VPVSPSSHPIRVPGLVCRARVVALAALALCAAGTHAAAAVAAPRSATVCASSVVMVESPGGQKVGVLHHGDRVRLITARGGAKWWRVAARFGTRGWVRASALCDREH
jgi:hypothetical protein